MNAIFFVGYCTGQMLSTQFWKAKYAPRFRVPWGIMLVRSSLSVISVSRLTLCSSRLHTFSASASSSSCGSTSSLRTRSATPSLLRRGSLTRSSGMSSTSSPMARLSSTRSRSSTWILPTGRTSHSVTRYDRPPFHHFLFFLMTIGSLTI